MNHTATLNSGLTSRKESLDYLRENHPDVPYFISEWGNTLHGPINITACFGSALWALDLDLAAMVRGVARIAHTQGPWSAKALWIPEPLDSGVNEGPAQARAVFAATPVVADFIGREKNPGKVVELDVEGQDLMSAYAMYSGGCSGALAKVALINMKVWNQGDEEERGASTFVLPVEGLEDGTEVLVKRFVAEAGAGALGFDVDGPEGNVTWAGEQWSKKVGNGKGHFVNGHGEDVDTVEVEDGVVEVKVRDSEAAIIYLAHK